jgi:hypothetical protein
MPRKPTNLEAIKSEKNKVLTESEKNKCWPLGGEL